MLERLPNKRVLMVISVLARGGCERQLLATARGLLGRGYTIEIFKLDAGPDGETSFEAEFAALPIRTRCARDFGDMCAPPEDGCDAHGLARLTPILHHLNVVQLGFALEQAIRRFQPSIVHCWSEPSSVIGGLVAVSLGLPKIVIQLVMVPPLEQNLPAAALYRDAYRLLLSKPNVRLLNISMANARNLEEWLEIPRGSVKLLRNGFVPDSMRIRTQEEAKASRASLGIPLDAPTVGAIMRFAPQKDPDLWLETARLIAAERPDVWFVLAGYGELAEHFALKLEQMGLSQRSVLLGATHDVGAVYACMDVFLMTSQHEGTPNVLIEAQAAGVPVVAPDVGGIGETIAHGRTGCLVSGRDAARLANAVLEVLANPRLRRSARAHGPRFVSQRFDWGRKIDETIGHYNSRSGVLTVCLRWATQLLRTANPIFLAGAAGPRRAGD
jgi:glycosyltransferase involved in cell wall biosynthesis